MPPYVTLEDVRKGRATLFPNHIENLKKDLLTNVRAQWKKDRINNLTIMRLMSAPPHWSFNRIVFYPDGRAGYVTGQDYTYEIKEVITALIGKK